MLANKSGVQVCCATNMKRLRAGILISDEYNLENVELLIYDTLRDAGNEVGLIRCLVGRLAWWCSLLSVAMIAPACTSRRN